jgi:hypothetical protein
MKPTRLSYLYTAILYGLTLAFVISCEDHTYDPDPKDWNTEFENHLEAARSNEPSPSLRYLKQIEADKAREAGQHLAILDQSFGTPTEVTVEKFYCESCNARFYGHELDDGYCPKCIGSVAPSPEKKTGPRFRKQ